MEIWKDIPNYEGYYQASNLGRIKSFHYNNRRPGYILDPKIKSNEQYLCVGLTNSKKRKTWRVHQLIAITFLNHRPCGYKTIVDHIDNDPLNNKVDNLQLTTVRHNQSKDKKRKSSRYTGVRKTKNGTKWRSAMRINGKVKHLGVFKCEFAAGCAYQKRLKELNE